MQLLTQRIAALESWILSASQTTDAQIYIHEFAICCMVHLYEGIFSVESVILGVQWHKIWI